MSAKPPLAKEPSSRTAAFFKKYVTVDSMFRALSEQPLTI
jgi:hypothetical protein